MTPTAIRRGLKVGDAATAVEPVSDTGSTGS